MSQNTAITAEAIAFVEKVSYNDLPAEALRIGKRCMVDTLGVMIAGCSEHSVHILVDDALDQGGKRGVGCVCALQHRVVDGIGLQYAPGGVQLQTALG